MSIYGFDIKTSFDFLRKLFDERENFLKEPTSSRHAMNCALTGWHLHEWVFAEYKGHSALKQFKGLKEYAQYLYDKTDLRPLRDLADGSKHFALSRNQTDVLGTELQKVTKMFGPRRTIGEPILVVTTKFGNVGMKMFFDDLLYICTLYWYQFFREKLGVDVNLEKLNYTFF